MKSQWVFILMLLSALSASAQHVNIQDTAFLYALIQQGVDSNDDGLISFSEAEGITKLNIDGPHDYGWNYWYGYGCEGYSNITDLTGIEAFINLDSLRCICGSITSIDLSGNPKLKYLNCSYNQISDLDLRNNTALIDLTCGSNQLFNLGLSNNTALINLTCPENQLTNLDVSNCVNLYDLNCRDNQLEFLDISNSSQLNSILCESNQLTSLDVSGNTGLERLWCSYNKLETLDVSKNDSLMHLFCENNLLSHIDLSSNTVLQSLRISNNTITRLDISNNTQLKTYCSWGCIPGLALNDIPSLSEVCVWDGFSPDYGGGTWPQDLPPDVVLVDTSGSPNICFETNCDGICDNTLDQDRMMPGLSIYPIPAKDFITIEFVENAPALIDIYNIQGNLIFGTVSNSTSYTANVADYPGGVYYIRVKQKESTSCEIVIIK